MILPFMAAAASLVAGDVAGHKDDRAVVDPAPAAQADAAAGPIGDIVVTAQKRDERLQSVPIALTALNAQAIENARIRNIADIGSIVPSLSIRQSSGNGSALVTSMRGEVTATLTPAQDSGTSFYIDGVYLGSGNGLLFDLGDIERVEVIRGPAGTLFGTNSTSGAVNFIRSGPKGRWYARQELSYGNFSSFRSKTRIDLPEWRGLSLSMIYLHNYRGSDVRNATLNTFDASRFTNGEVSSLRSTRKLGTTRSDGAHIAARYRPTSGLTIDYSYDLTNDRRSANAVQAIGFVDGAAGNAYRTFVRQAAARVGLTLDDYLRQGRQTTVFNDGSTPVDTRIQSHALKVEYRPSDHLTIRNIASWRSTDRDFSINQLDGLGNLFVPDASGSLQPYYILSSYSSDERRQFSNETQFIITTKPLDVTAGLFYYNRYSNPGRFFGGSISFQPFPGYVLPTGPSTAERQGYFRNRSTAGFGQATYHLNDRIDLTGGIRYTKETKAVFDTTRLPGVNSDFDEGRFTYLANISYRPSARTLVYAKYSTGFIGGGLAVLRASVLDPATGQQIASGTPVPFRSQTVKSTEAGIKTDLFGNRLRVNLAAFHAVYDNLQLTSVVSFCVQASTGCIPTVGFAPTNIGRSRAYGLEYEITAVPINRLILTANGSFTDFDYLRLASTVGSIDTYPEILRPKAIANLAGEYTIPLSGGMDLVLRGEGTFRSREILATSQPHAASNPDAPYLNQSRTRPPTWLLNGSVALANVNLGPSTVRVSAWGRNLTNRKRVESFINLGTVISATFEQPRTYGVDLSVTF